MSKKAHKLTYATTGVLILLAGYKVGYHPAAPKPVTTAPVTAPQPKPTVTTPASAKPATKAPAVVTAPKK